MLLVLLAVSLLFFVFAETVITLKAIKMCNFVIDYNYGIICAILCFFTIENTEICTDKLQSLQLHHNFVSTLPHLIRLKISAILLAVLDDRADRVESNWLCRFLQKVAEYAFL